MTLRSLAQSTGLPSVTPPGPPIELDAAAIVALDATAWYDAFYLRNEANPSPVPTLTSILAEVDAVWYDAKDLT